MLRTLRTATRRRAVLIAAGTAVLVAVGGGATAALASTSDSAPTAAPTSAACHARLRAELLGAMPAALKADLETLRADPKGQRAAERKVIRAKALSGAYGVRVERVVRVVAGARADGRSLRASLPADLKADLKTLRATEPGGAARQAEVRTIETKALAGGYGATIEQHVQAVQQRAQERCAAK